MTDDRRRRQWEQTGQGEKRGNGVIRREDFGSSSHRWHNGCPTTGCGGRCAATLGWRCWRVSREGGLSG